MKIEELDFPYPEPLIATERAARTRVMLVSDAGPREINVEELIETFAPGDTLVINDTKVLRRRVFCESGLEILFLAPIDAARLQWRVLCPSSRWKTGPGRDGRQTLPGGVMLSLIERGRTQIVEADRPLDEAYFEMQGELPLPPYIQKARGERGNRPGDRAEYQTAWAREAGSLAAPTASLHFSAAHIARLRERGVNVEAITLHVGLGTFLPITVDFLEDHVMHAEQAFVSLATWQKLTQTREAGRRVWALGTTVTRTLESVAHGRLEATPEGFAGATDLFIRPGQHDWKIVNGLLTNFHQPRSTLLALVASFASLERVQENYRWAIENQFRLFSYGDLSVWTK